MCPKNPQRDTTRRHPKQKPKWPQLTSFDAEQKQLYSDLPPDGLTPHLISKAEPSHPLIEAHFNHLYCELTVILATSHLSSAHWRSWLEETNRTTSAKKQKCYLEVPKSDALLYALSSYTWKSQTESVTRGSPGGVQHALVNYIDLVPTLQT